MDWRLTEGSHLYVEWSLDGAWAQTPASCGKQTGQVTGDRYANLETRCEAPCEGKRSRWLVVGLVLLSFSLHLWRIDARSIWWDESLSLFRAQRSVPYILSNRIDFPGIPTTDQHPPLYFLLLHLVIRLGGESDLVLRFPSAAFATLLVPLLYAMGCRVWGSRVGLLAALLGALSPFYLWYAQEARMYTMVTALGMLSLYALWRALEDRRWSWGVVSVLAACVAATTQYLFSLALCCQGILGLFVWWGREAPAAAPSSSRGRTRVGFFRKAAMCWGAGILFLVLLLLAYEVRSLFPTLGTYREFVPLGVMLVDVLNSYSLGLSVNLRDVWALDVLFLVIYAVGVAATWARPPRPREEGEARAPSPARGARLMLLLGYVLVPVVALWCFSLFVPVYTNSRYAMISSPAFYLGLGVGLSAVARWRRTLALLLTLGLAGSMGLSISRYFSHEHYQTKEDYRSAVALIAANERVGDVIIVNGPESVPAFGHYYDGDLPVLGLPVGGVRPEEITEKLRVIAQAYDRVWLVRARIALSDPGQVVREWMDNHAMLLLRKGYPSCGFYLSVSAYLPRPPIQPPPAAAKPLGIFQDRLALLDCRIRYFDAKGGDHEIPSCDSKGAVRQREAALMAPMPAGKLVSTVLFWRPLRGLGTYKISLRLVGGSTIWAQRDRLPFMLLPTNDWPVGEGVRHEADLWIPHGTPPGVYDLQLRVYEAESGSPLPFRRATDEGESLSATLGQVAVAACARPVPESAFVPEEVVQEQWTTVFGGELELLAHRVTPESVPRGGALRLELYWRARRLMSQDHRLVINWEDAQGETWHTSSYSLTGRDYPTSRWRVGEMVRGILHLAVPDEAPAGVHKVHLLVHSPDDGEFLWFGRGVIPWLGHNLQLAEVVVEHGKANP